MIKLLPEDQLILPRQKSKKKLEQLYRHLKLENASRDRITSSSTVQDLVEELYQHFEIDVLVNNAGYGIFEVWPDYQWADSCHALESITLPLMRFSRLIGAHMKEAGKGHIVNIVQYGGARCNSQIQPLFSY